LKPVAWRKKMPSDLHQRASLPSELLSLDLTQTIRARKPNSFERILAHRIDCQRARASCPAGKLPNNLMSIGRYAKSVNTHFQFFHSHFSGRGVMHSAAPIWGESLAFFTSPKPSSPRRTTLAVSALG
jgi:hypothetical protein